MDEVEQKQKAITFILQLKDKLHSENERISMSDYLSKRAQSSIVAENEDTIQNIDRLLYTFCDHKWTTDLFEHRGEAFELTYCLHCELQKNA